jgi:hypothetical protein
VVCSWCVARSGRPALRWGPASVCSQPSSKFPLAYYARYTHPLDQGPDEGSLAVPQEEASEDADYDPVNADLLTILLLVVSFGASDGCSRTLSLKWSPGGPHVP